VFSLLGPFLRSFGRKGSAPGEFNRPSAVGVCSGRVLVAEFTGKRLQVLDRNGAPLQIISHLPRCRVSAATAGASQQQNGHSGAERPATAAASPAPARLDVLFVDEEEGLLLVSAAAPAEQPMHTFRIVQTAQRAA